MPDTDPLARVTLRDGMHFEAITRSAPSYPIALDSDAGLGGRDLGVRPQQMLLVSLAGCAAMDVLSILRKKQQKVTGLEVQVRAEQANEYPDIYTHIWLKFLVAGHEVQAEAVRRSIELSMTKYCPVVAMIQPNTPIDTEFEIVSSD